MFIAWENHYIDKIDDGLRPLFPIFVAIDVYGPPCCLPNTCLRPTKTQEVYNLSEHGGKYLLGLYNVLYFQRFIELRNSLDIQGK